MPRGIIGLGIAGMVALLLAGCSASSTPAKQTVAGTAQTPDVKVVATDQLKFEPASLTVRAGQPVRVSLENPGALAHDFTIVGMPVKDIKNAMDDHMGHSAEAGKIMGDLPAKHQAEVAFTPTQAGTYEFYCSVPGHKEAGMKGMLKVE